MADQQQLARKLSVRTVFGSKGDVLTRVMSDKSKPHVLFTIGGMVTSYKTGSARIEGENDVRPWMALMGRFKAINKDTGEVFYAGKAFLPSYVTEALVAALEPEEVDSVKFLYDVWAAYDEKSATSYVYGITNLVPAAPDDVLENLVPDPNKAIAGPKPDTTTDTGTGKGK